MSTVILPLKSRYQHLEYHMYVFRGHLGLVWTARGLVRLWLIHFEWQSCEMHKKVPANDIFELLLHIPDDYPI